MGGQKDAPCFLEKGEEFVKKCLQSGQKYDIIERSKRKMRLLHKYLPVAQLDSASDSDSEGQRFESVRVGQTNNRGACPPVFCLLYSIGQEKRYTKPLAVCVWVLNPFG